MALPSSGQISIDDVYQEAVAEGYSGAKSLKQLSQWWGWEDLPYTLFHPPYALSEFYDQEAADTSNYIFLDVVLVNLSSYTITFPWNTELITQVRP